ncbi:uncharacterized protein [Henckelia pumila]|uniref:uncharacterized protein n=1 Tax=Henckelia pumila TaxID=405737 RepID=UPI003C6E9AB3
MDELFDSLDYNDDRRIRVTTEVDTLDKTASLVADASDREVIRLTELVAAIEIGTPDPRIGSWMAPLISYILTGSLPKEPDHARKIKRQVSRFTILNGTLYRPSYHGLMLKCLTEEETEYIIREVHEVCCGDHGGDMSLTRMVLLAGYWWPTLYADAKKTTQSCEGCQRYGNFHHSLTTYMQPILASCSFDK